MQGGEHAVTDPSSDTILQLQLLFGKLKKKIRTVNEKTLALDQLKLLLNCCAKSGYASSVPNYGTSSLINDLLFLSFKEFNEIAAKLEKTTSSKPILKWDTFDVVQPHILQAITNNDGDEVEVVPWIEAAFSIPIPTEVEQKVLFTLQEFLSRVDVVHMNSAILKRLWHTLWSRFTEHTHNSRSVACDLLQYVDCLLPLLRRAKQTSIAACADFVPQLLKLLQLPATCMNLWRHKTLLQSSAVLSLLRLLLHDWGFSHRECLLPSLLDVVLSVVDMLDYSNVGTLPEPFSEIVEGSREVHAWLLVEECLCLASPDCSSLSPASTHLASNCAYRLVAKYACLTMSADSLPHEPSTRSNSRLLARCLLLDMLSPSSSHFTHALSYNQPTPVKRRRSMNDPLLKRICRFDLSNLILDMTRLHVEEKLPVRFATFSLRVLSVVFGVFGHRLGHCLHDLISTLFQLRETVQMEELLAPLATLLNEVEQCRQRYLPSLECDVAGIWRTALSWSHAKCNFDPFCHLLITTDSWLLRQECGGRSRLPQLLDVLRSAPPSQATLLLLQHIVCNYEFREGDHFILYKDDLAGDEWRFRKELMLWLLQSFSASAAEQMLLLCMHFPRIKRQRETAKNILSNPERQLLLVMTGRVDERESPVEAGQDLPLSYITTLLHFLSQQLTILWDKSGTEEEKVRLWKVMQVISHGLGSRKISAVPASLMLTASDWLRECLPSLPDYLVLDAVEMGDWMGGVGASLAEALLSRSHSLPALLPHLIPCSSLHFDTPSILSVLREVRDWPADGIFPQRLGRLVQQLSRDIGQVIDIIQLMRHSHLFPSRTVALLLSNMSQLVEEEIENGEAASHSDDLLHLLMHFSQDSGVVASLVEGDSPLLPRLHDWNSMLPSGEPTLHHIAMISILMRGMYWQLQPPLLAAIVTKNNLLQLCRSYIPGFDEVLLRNLVALRIEGISVEGMEKESREADELLSRLEDGFVGDSELWCALSLPSSQSSLLCKTWRLRSELRVLLLHCKQDMERGDQCRVAHLCASLAPLNNHCPLFFLVTQPILIQCIEAVVLRGDEREVRAVLVEWWKLESISPLDSSPSIIFLSSLPISSSLRDEFLPASKIEGEKHKVDEALDQEDPSPFILTDFFWQRAAAELASRADSVVLRKVLVSGIRCLHEASITVTASSCVLPGLSPLERLSRSSFTDSSFIEFIRLHCHLFFHSRRHLSVSESHFTLVCEVLSHLPEERSSPCEGVLSPPTNSSPLYSLAFASATRPWKLFLLKLLPALPILNVSTELLPFLCGVCDAEEAASALLPLLPDVLLEKGGVGPSVVVAECIHVLGVERVARLAPLLLSSSQLGKMSSLLLGQTSATLSSFFLHLTADSSLECKRALLLWEEGGGLSAELSQLHAQSAVARGDAASAAALPPSLKASPDVLRLLAEKKHEWTLLDSRDAHFCLGQPPSENDFVADAWKLREWKGGGFIKKISSPDQAFFDSLRLLREDKPSANSFVSSLRLRVERRLAENRELVSQEVGEGVRELRLFDLLKGINGDKSYDVAEEIRDRRRSPLKTGLILACNAAMCQLEWEMEVKRMTSLSHHVHQVVMKTVSHLEKKAAYKPAMRLLSDWRQLAAQPQLHERLQLEESKLLARQGRDAEALLLLNKFGSPNKNDELFYERATIHAELATVSGNNLEKAKKILENALSLGCPSSSRHDAFVRLFEMSSRQLAEAENVCESSGFRMKKEAIRRWRDQLQNRREMNSKTAMRLSKELQCEEDEVKSMQLRLSELARGCILYGLQGIATAPQGGSVDILFPLLDIICKYATSPEHIELLRKHVHEVDVVQWLPAISHVVSHVFSSSPLQNCIQLLFHRLLIAFPFHTLPRLLFYRETSEQQRVEKMLNGVRKEMRTLTPYLDAIITSHNFFYKLTLLSLEDSNHFTKMMRSKKIVYNMKDSVSAMLRDAQLSSVPMPTQQLQSVADPEVLLSMSIRVNKVDEVVEKADGLSAPHILKVTATDGSRHRIICKKEDVRQDCMVEQLFEVVNSLLSRRRPRKHQALRTYKVVPLSIDAGLIEWCQHTVSIKELLCGLDRKSGLHQSVYPEDWTAAKCMEYLKPHANSSPEQKVKAFTQVCKNFRPVFRQFFYRNYGSVQEWAERLAAYRQSLAQWSIVCYMVGLGDRHSSNVLFEPATATFVHIDLGMILEYSKRSLPVPERVPFRMTRDLLDPLVADQPLGPLFHIAVHTIDTLRQKSSVIIGVASVLLRETMSSFVEVKEGEGPSLMSQNAIFRLRDKLAGTDASHAPQTPEAQVRRLFQEATDIQNLATLFVGWMPFM